MKPILSGSALVEPPTQIEERQGPSMPVEGGPWGVRDVVLAVVGALVAFVVVGGIAGLIASAVTGKTEGAPIVAAVLASGLVFYAIVLAIVWRFSVKKYGLSFSTFGFRSLGSDRLWIPVAVGLSAWVTALAFTAVVQAVGVEAQQDLEELFDTRALLPLTGVVTVLAAPFAEETFFRGFVFRGLLGRFGLWRAAGASGLLFGALHITGLASLPLVVPFTLIGILFAWVYYRTGTLWTSIGAHLLFNLISFVGLVALVEN
jgi:membrane protease YdiL (CAAX protease family)